MGNACVQVRGDFDPNTPRKDNLFKPGNKKSRVAPIGNFMDLSSMEHETANAVVQQKEGLDQTLESNTSMKSQDLKSLLSQDELTSLKKPEETHKPKDRAPVNINQTHNHNPTSNINANPTFKKRSLVIANHLNTSHNPTSRFSDQTHNFVGMKSQDEIVEQQPRFELRNQLVRGRKDKMGDDNEPSDHNNIHEPQTSGELEITNTLSPLPRIRQNADMMPKPKTGNDLNNAMTDLHLTNKDDDGGELEQLSLNNNNEPSSPNTSKSPHSVGNHEEEDILFKTTDPTNTAGGLQVDSTNNKQAKGKQKQEGDQDVKYNINLQANATEEELRYLHSYRFDVKGTQLPSTENTAPNESSPTQADSEDLDLEGKKNPEEEALLKSNKRRMTRPVVENNERKRSIGNTITIAFSEKADKIRRIKEWIDDTILDDLSSSPLEPLSSFTHLEIYRTFRESMKENNQQTA